MLAFGQLPGPSMGERTGAGGTLGQHYRSRRDCVCDGAHRPFV